MHQIDKNDSALSVFVEFVELVNSTRLTYEHGRIERLT